MGCTTAAREIVETHNVCTLLVEDPIVIPAFTAIVHLFVPRTDDLFSQSCRSRIRGPIFLWCFLFVLFHRCLVWVIQTPTRQEHCVAFKCCVAASRPMHMILTGHVTKRRPLPPPPLSLSSREIWFGSSKPTLGTLPSMGKYFLAVRSGDYCPSPCLARPDAGRRKRNDDLWKG